MDQHTGTAAAPHEGTGRDPKWWTLVAVCLGIFILLLDITIVNVALADIQDELDGTLSDLQWVIDAYALSLAALLLTAGSLADLFGRRRVFVIGTALFMVGSIACGAAQDMFFLQLARAFQGVGGAAMFATGLALIASAFHGRDRGTAFGAFGATTGVAVAVGPVLGGVLTSGISWRWIFFVNIPICLLAIAIAVLRVRESHDPRAGRPDWFGFVTFSLSLASLVYGLIRAGQTEWRDGRVVFCLVAAAVLLVVFLVSQVRGEHPMFDLSLLRKPTFTGGLIAAFGVSASVFSLLTYLVIYVQNVLGYSPVGAGVRFLFLSGASFVAAAVAGRLTSQVPAKWLIAPGFVVLGVGLLLIHGIRPDSSWTHLIPGLLVSGLGVGMINTPLASTAVGVVSVERSGMASGINSTLRQVGIATGIAVLGTIFAHRVADGIRDGLAGTPLAGRSDQIADAVTGGQTDAVIRSAPPGVRDQLAAVTTSSFVDALNHIDLIAMALAFVSAACCFVLIRQKDFVQGGPGGVAPAAPQG
jgi:EmrB/QacA subfamily drug resistance transporter